MLTELGLYRLWHEDPERAWPFVRAWMPAVLRLLAPNYGYGIDRMPKSGGGVVAANHFSAVDPPLIGIYSRRTIYFMTKVELLDLPVAGEALRWLGSFAVRRGRGDRDALRVARWAIGVGHVVGMFMEGTRQRFGYPGPVHPGAAMLAIREGVPVIPCGLDTFSWSLRRPRTCGLVFGQPIDLSGLPQNGRGYKEGAGIIEAEICRLWQLASNAVADGFPPELPDGARRSGPLRNGDTFPALGVEPWPREPWAEGPLGPVWPGRRAS
jgi:1-acyl-sn-glycerol-3-phosphate acyltransferase